VTGESPANYAYYVITLLLREILAKNPFKNKCWGEIAEFITRADFQLDGKRVRERSQLLIDQQKKSRSLFSDKFCEI
jgi:hypothetical protein